MKTILKIVGVLVVLLIIGVVLVGKNIGPIVKAGIENLGPKITQVPISVDAVDMSLMGGSVTVKGLVVGNPSGYKTPQAMKLGTATVSVDPRSITADKIVVRSIHIVAPEIFFEGGLSGNNLNKILANVNSAAASLGLKAGEKPPPKLEIDDLLISGAKTHVSLQGFATQGLTLALPELHWSDMGKGTDGITAAELVRVVMSRLTAITVEEVTKQVAGSSEALKNLGNNLGKDAGASGIDVIKKGIGGLLGK